MLAFILVSLAFIAAPVHSYISSIPQADSNRTCSANCGTSTQPPLTLRQDSDNEDDVPIPPPTSFALSFAVATYSAILVGTCFYCAFHREKLYLYLSQLRF